MNVLIVEDESLAADRLEKLIGQCAGDAKVVAKLESIQETVEWLERHGPPDLLFLDVHLSDGQCWEVFRASEVFCPVVFTTAYDNFFENAFKANGIEYLLKPIDRERLESAIKKCRNLRDHFVSHGRPDVPAFPPGTVDRAVRYRERFLARKGDKYLSIPRSRVAYFVSENKLSFVVATDGERYLMNDSLTELETQVDPSLFFRANRRFLVSIDAIARFRSNRKSQVELTLTQDPGLMVIISDDRSSDFRRWIDR